MISVDEGFAFFNMFVFDDFTHGQHRRAEVVDMAQALPKFLGGLVFAQSLTNVCNAARFAPRRLIRETRIMKQVVAPHEFRKLFPSAVA